MNDVRKMIYGTIIGFFILMAGWFSLIYISSCGFTLTCYQASPIVIRTPIPTLIPAAHVENQGVENGMTEFNRCKVAATDLIGAWVMAGHTEKEPFPFTDLNGQSCEGTFADIAPLFIENSIWFPGSVGCTSCHNAELNERSSGLDLSSYEAISWGTRRVPEATGPGTDIFGRGEWENSILYDVLINQGLVPHGHSPDAPPNQVIIYAGQMVTEAEVTITPTP